MSDKNNSIMTTKLKVPIVLICFTRAPPIGTYLTLHPQGSNFAVQIKFWWLFSVFLWFRSKKGVSFALYSEHSAFSLFSYRFECSVERSNQSSVQVSADGPTQHLDNVSSASSFGWFTVVKNHCWRSWGVTHCWRWPLERELWCFGGWTSRPAGDWRSCLQHRCRRWISPWEIGNISENIAFALRTKQKVSGNEAGRLKHKQ